MSAALRWRAVPMARAAAAALATGRGTMAADAGWWVICTDPEGVEGIGEVTPMPAFGGESTMAAATALTAWLARPISLPAADDLGSALASHGLDPSRTPVTHAGVELALLDLLARRAGLPLWRWLGGSGDGVVSLNALVLGTTPKDAADDARAWVTAGFGTLKLKVGLGTLEEDLDRVAAVRQAAGPDVALRLDANGCWDEQGAMWALAAFAPYDIDYVEQPVGVQPSDALARVAAAAGVAVAADESVAATEAHSALVAGGLAAWVIKPAMVGGLRAAGRLADEARAAGARAILSGTLDTGVATAGALHLAAAKGLPGPHGLALAAPYPVVRGQVRLGEAPGLGRGAGWPP